MNKQQFLAMSLPHRLKMLIPNKLTALEMIGINVISLEFWEDGVFTHESKINCKPILYPLSYLTKEITHNGETFVPYKKLGWEYYGKELGTLYDFGDCHKEIIDFKDGLHDALKLVEWHFNLMDESEEFVDVTTLPKNPYK